METFQKRLNFLIEKFANGKPTVFAKKCGIPPGTFHPYLEKGTIPETKQLMKIASVYRINLNWLLLGEGEAFKEEKMTEPETPLSEKPPAKVVYFDDAVEILMEAERETGVTLNDRQRQAALRILRKELAIAKAKSIVRAIKEEEEKD